jgi:formylglycine-generating enzyme required for sulfatase activity
VGPKEYESGPLFEPLGANRQGHPVYRRRVDGMICVLVPEAEVLLGTDDDSACTDERPAHRVRLDKFVIDQEPVSTAAYCRFLNSTGPVDPSILQEWFLLQPEDRRRDHLLLKGDGDGWTPLPGAERMPMMLVSWYGANAYSLWANRRDWRGYHNDGTDGDIFLPSEAQWEYAARGSELRTYPWGDDEATPQRMRYAQHSPGRTYRVETLPMAEVNEELGVSPFGLNHMAGNVWQWCRDWYSTDFYATPQASAANPVNRRPTQIRSERGGSWIGPAFLCRSSYRRGRVPCAKGRCLGFRCVSDPQEV